jgi:DNA-binding transcriptional regulator YiaG
LANVYSEAYGRFLARLREARKQARLSQAEVARRLKRPQSFVSKCESGERRVDVIELRLLKRRAARSLPCGQDVL